MGIEMREGVEEIYCYITSTLHTQASSLRRAALSPADVLCQRYCADKKGRPAENYREQFAVAPGLSSVHMYLLFVVGLLTDNSIIVIF